MVKTKKSFRHDFLFFSPRFLPIATKALVKAEALSIWPVGEREGGFESRARHFFMISKVIEIPNSPTFAVVLASCEVSLFFKLHQEQNNLQEA